MNGRSIGLGRADGCGVGHPSGKIEYSNTPSDTRSAVQAGIDGLRSVADEMSSALSLLQSKIEPVLSPVQEVKEAGGPSSPRPPMSQIVGQLDELLYSFETLRQQVSSLIRRVEC